MHVHQTLSSSEGSSVYLVGTTDAAATDMSDIDFDSDAEDNENACVMKVLFFCWSACRPVREPV